MNKPSIPPELRQPTPRPAYLPISVYFRVLFLSGAAIAVAAIWVWAFFIHLANWRIAAYGKQVLGTVVKVEDDSVHFTYKIDSDTYEAVAEDPANQNLLRLPPGSPVLVRYVESNPSDGRLERKDEETMVADAYLAYFLYPLILLVALFAAFMSWHLWSKARMHLIVLRDGHVRFCTLTKAESANKKERRHFVVGYDAVLPEKFPCSADVWLPKGDKPPDEGDVMIALQLHQVGQVNLPVPYHSLYEARVRLLTEYPEEEKDDSPPPETGIQEM